jgi:4-hydroxybenzoate polyprenyltransferase
LIGGQSNRKGAAMFLVIYIVAALAAAWLGRNKQIGFVGFLLVALIATPVVALIVLLISQDRRPQLPS